MNEDNTYDCTTEILSLGHAGLYKKTTEIEENNFLRKNSSPGEHIHTIQSLVTEVLAHYYNQSDSSEGKFS